MSNRKRTARGTCTFKRALQKAGIEFSSLNIERWEQLPLGDGRYYVSTHGNVLRRSSICVRYQNGLRVEQPLKGRYIVGNKLSQKGYRRVHIAGRTYFVHQLVARTFIPNPLNRESINHKNGTKTDNHVDNLEWCTPAENTAHARKTGLIQLGSKVHSSKITEKDVLEIRVLAKKGVMQKDIGKKFGLSQQNVSKIVLGLRWKHVH